MNRVLAFTDTDGQVRLVYPDKTFQKEWESEEQALYRLVTKAIPAVSFFICCDPEKIPTDLTFRRTWVLGNVLNPIQLDFFKCLTIHRERMQIASERKRKALEANLADAIQRSHLPEQIAIKKTQKILETLHEMNLTHCKTIEDIKYSIPRELHPYWDFYNPTKEQSNEPVTSTHSSEPSLRSRDATNH